METYHVYNADASDQTVASVDGDFAPLSFSNGQVVVADSHEDAALRRMRSTGGTTFSIYLWIAGPITEKHAGTLRKVYVKATDYEVVPH